MRKLPVYIVIILSSIILFSYCTANKNSHADLDKFRSIHEDIEYVGMQTCRSCHQDIYESYIKTGMGQSFGLARKEVSDAIFDGHSLVYDSLSNFYYKPFFKDSIYYIQEFRMEGQDTIHQRTEQVDYIVGSGQHTNSHILNNNGYLTQAPITFYTQKQKWDLAPGFEDTNYRFSRILESECLTCHNHFPEQAAGSLNKYLDIPTGIQCERCHGPGKLHVELKLAGESVDTSKYIDYSIVNPRHLPIDLQMDVCQRCHLQGVAVLQDGKDFYDFKPGMHLADVMNVFLPRFTDSHENFIMASQADRLRLSACFESGKLSCITCHNPHQGIQVQKSEHYNLACQSCHEVNICTTPKDDLQAENNNCVKCHMPPSHSIDIPHVSITDHNIRVPDKLSNKSQDRKFLGLESLSKEEVTDIEMARGYLALYDKFIENDQILDSAAHYLQTAEGPLLLQTQIHYYFASKDYQSIVNLENQNNDRVLSDAWTSYRMGEAFLKQKKYEKAIVYLKNACTLMPLNLDFQEKKGSCFLYLEYYAEAEKTFLKVIEENPKRAQAYLNLGYAKVVQNRFSEAEENYLTALELDPDLEQACLNLAALYILKKQKSKAKKFLQRVLVINPENAQAKYQMGLID